MSVFMKLLLVTTFISNTLVLAISDRITGLGMENVNEEYGGTYKLMWVIPAGNHPANTLCNAESSEMENEKATATENKEMQLLQRIQSGLIYTQSVVLMLDSEPEAPMTANSTPVVTNTNKGQTT